MKFTIKTGLWKKSLSVLCVCIEDLWLVRENNWPILRMQKGMHVDLFASPVPNYSYAKYIGVYLSHIYLYYASI